MEPLSAKRVRIWLDTLPFETRERLFLLLDEVCAGVDLSRHNQFGFLRLRAELETSGGPLEELRTEVASQGHPDFR